MSKKQFDSFSDELNHYRHTGGAPKRCYESHPALDLGGGLKVYGGSCLYPSVTDADVYIGFDQGMRLSNAVFPWNVGGKIEVYFHITDGTAPKNAGEFKKMIVWAAEQIRAGKKLHAGCIGGHGRTGTFLAALVAHMMDMEDAITYVRQNYCQKAVESTEQVNFLHDHYGIKKVSASKAHLYDHHVGSARSWKSTSPSHQQVSKSHGYVGSSGAPKKETKPVVLSSSAKQIHPVESARNIWSI